MLWLLYFHGDMCVSLGGGAVGAAFLVKSVNVNDVKVRYYIVDTSYQENILLIMILLQLCYL